MKLDTLYKKTTVGKTQTWTIEVEDDKFRTISGQSDGKKITNKWTICQPKNVGKKNATTGETQAIKQALVNHFQKRSMALEILRFGFRGIDKFGADHEQLAESQMLDVA